MKPIVRSGLLLLAGLTLCPAVPAWADEVRIADLGESLATLPAKRAATAASAKSKLEVTPVRFDAAEYDSMYDDDSDYECGDDVDCSDEVDCSEEVDYCLDTNCAAEVDESESYDCGTPAVCCGETGGCDCDCERGRIYGEVQAMWLRAHMNEDVVGKLSEFYDFTPRFIVGYEDAYGVGGRGRYWQYGEDLNTLSGDQIRFEFGVFDVEGSKRLDLRSAELTISGGARFADLELTDDDGDTVDNSMLGLTVAADLRAVVSRTCRSECAFVGGARWSILGGNWEGDGGNDFTGGEVRDDNLTVQEIYGGFEWGCQTEVGDVFARLVWEMQNWHSDVLAQNSGTDTIGFVGPGVHFGMSY